VSLLFVFIELPESPRLIHATYPTKMRQYKILAQILLMLSVTGFALAAPVAVRDHEVRVSVANAAKGGPYANNPPSELGLRGFLNPPLGPGSSVPMSTSTHDAPPQIGSSLDRSPSFSSWLPPPESQSGSASSWSSGSGWQSVSTTDESNSMDQSSQNKKEQELASTAESRPPSAGQIGHPPPPAPKPGLSTKRPLPPGAESLNAVKKAAGILMGMSRQGFRPRAYGSGAVDAAKGELVGTIDTRANL
jgi:hypothetical protein